MAAADFTDEHAQGVVSVRAGAGIDDGERAHALEDGLPMDDERAKLVAFEPSIETISPAGTRLITP